jgi:hypothetical protein
VATVESVGVVAGSAASESLPAHTPAAITAARTAAAAATGNHRAASFCCGRPRELRELEERDPDDLELDELEERLA